MGDSLKLSKRQMDRRHSEWSSINETPRLDTEMGAFSPGTNVNSATPILGVKKNPNENKKQEGNSFQAG